MIVPQRRRNTTETILQMVSALQEGPKSYAQLAELTGLDQVAAPAAEEAGLHRRVRARFCRSPVRASVGLGRQARRGAARPEPHAGRAEAGHAPASAQGGRVLIPFDVTTEPRLTPWFPATSRPARPGYYHTRLPNVIDLHTGQAQASSFLRYFDGQDWLTYEGGIKIRYQDREWRGFAKKP